MKRFLQELKDSLAKAAANQPQVRFQDHPIASTIDWSPLKGGGSNFKTHKLQLISERQASFGSTIGARLFAAIFAIIGAVVLVIGCVMTLGTLVPGIFLVAFGSLFAGVGVWLYRQFDQAIFFDLDAGLFYQGKRPNLADASQKPDTWCRLDDIIGIQLLREHVSGSKSSYYSYEINLVLEDGSRRNVVDHGSLGQIRQDAQILAGFLEVPLWDGI